MREAFLLSGFLAGIGAPFLAVHRYGVVGTLCVTATVFYVLGVWLEGRMLKRAREASDADA